MQTSIVFSVNQSVGFDSSSKQILQGIVHCLTFSTTACRHALEMKVEYEGSIQLSGWKREAAILGYPISRIRQKKILHVPMMSKGA